MMKVERFQSGKHGLERYNNDRDVENKRRKLEKDIKSHAFSRANY